MSLRVWISTLALLSLTNCEFRLDERPSILVIAVENLSSDSIRCDADDMTAGFALLCEDSIRFTHAFTPSTMSQASMSSLMTGDYPTRHGVHDNGFEHLLARFRTVGEAAVDKGYRTAFISGGPPIFRKSGLSQGFELFDDNLELSLGRYYRPASEGVEIFLDWLSKEVSTSPFLGVLFLPDLQFPHLPAFTTSGELPERTESQLQLVGESIRTLVEGLKARRRWNSTYVILVGLGGEYPPSDLRSENTQVPLLIKPPRNSKDASPHWTIDRNVSLVDVGVTLFSILGESVNLIDNESLEKVSLTGVFSTPEPDWRENRLIYSESGWTRWRLGGGIRASLREKQFLMINENPRLIFNSLTDRLEQTPISDRDPLWSAVKPDFEAAISHLGLDEEKPVQAVPKKYELGRIIWSAPETAKSPIQKAFDEAVQHGDSDPIVTGWWARWAMEREDWKPLARLGLSAHKPLWTFTGENRSGQPQHSLSESVECGNLFRGSVVPGNCNDEGLLSLNRWIQEKNEDDRTIRRDRFLRWYSNERVQDRVGQLNYLNWAKWDVRPEFPRAPLLTELFLALPRNKSHFSQINSWLGAKDLSL